MSPYIYPASLLHHILVPDVILFLPQTNDGPCISLIEPQNEQSGDSDFRAKRKIPSIHNDINILKHKKEAITKGSHQIKIL